MTGTKKAGRGGAVIILLILMTSLVFPACVTEKVSRTVVTPLISDHFDGTLFFNPRPEVMAGSEVRRGSSRWIWRWVFGAGFPEWPEKVEVTPGPAPARRVEVGALRIIAVGHSTFLIQMDGLNILTDPIWSERCSPVSWVGPRRRQEPGLRFEDLPPIDVVLVSHNHYDHLDLPTLKRLAGKGAMRSVVPLGNRDLVRSSGLPQVDELDWWQSIRLSPQVTVTLVPAQHFSSRTLWDRNKTLWGGFVISGPSGNVFYGGDTGYGPHFQEIGRRFAPIKAALLPIAPFRPAHSKEVPPAAYMNVHMGPEDAVRAHVDLGAEVSMAAHFRVFQLGWDGFDEAVNGLASSREARNLKPHEFIALEPGQSKDFAPSRGEARSGVPEPPPLSLRTIAQDKIQSQPPAYAR